jgi:hypothetical protein
MKWYELQTDDAMGKVKDCQKAGVISMKISIRDTTEDGLGFDFKDYDAWKKKVPKRLDVKKVRAYVF